MKPPSEFKPPSNLDNLIVAIAALFLLVLIAASLNGCISKPSGPEPKWAPDIYRHKEVNTRCTFYSPVLAHTIDCDEPVIDEYLLIHSDFFDKLVDKFERCQSWKLGD